MSSTEFVVWGYKPGLLPEPYPIRLAGGNVRTCRAEQAERKAQGWMVGIYRAGDTPAGLRDQVYAAHGYPSAGFLAAIGQPLLAGAA